MGVNDKMHNGRPGYRECFKVNLILCFYYQKTEQWSIWWLEGARESDLAGGVAEIPFSRCGCADVDPTIAFPQTCEYPECIRAYVVTSYKKPGTWLEWFFTIAHYFSSPPHKINHFRQVFWVVPASITRVIESILFSENKPSGEEWKEWFVYFVLFCYSTVRFFLMLANVCLFTIMSHLTLVAIRTPLFSFVFICNLSSKSAFYSFLLLLLLFKRPYSISSSQKLYPCEVHVTVALVSYQINSKFRSHVSRFPC